MKNKLAEKYIHYTMVYLEEHNECISKEIKNLAVSFGPDVLSIGLLPAIVSYEGSTQRGADAKKLLNAILEILAEDKQTSAATNNYSTLKDYVNRAPEDKHQKKECILAVATALKVVLRTYPEANEKQDTDKKKEGDENQ